MDGLKVGIIGAGYIGSLHAGILLRDERVRLVGICDVLVERAEKLAHSTGATVYTDADELIDQADAVFVTTPNTKHTVFALTAIAAGKHVFCEKPMATDLDDAQAILKAVKASRVIFQVGHNRRFAPVYATLKQMVTDGLKPHSASLKMNRGELLNPVWVADPEVTGGFLYETTIHMFDMARFLFGEVAKLMAIGSSHEYPETDDFSVLLGFENGMHATLSSSSDASWHFPFERVEVYGHHQTLVTCEMESLSISTNIEGHYTMHSTHQLAKEEKWGYAQEDKAFVDAILYDIPPPVTALDGYKSVELVDACYRTIKRAALAE